MCLKIWIDVALGQLERANMTIDALLNQPPFDMKYHQITKVPWESYAKVLDAMHRRQYLAQGWGTGV